MPAAASVDITLRWRDLDALGHLNQAVYHEFLEEARGALIAGLDRHFAFVLVRVELDYRHEVRRTDGRVTASAWVTKVGTKSFTVGQEIVLPGGEVAASGTSVLVAWDPHQRTSRPLTGEERAALEG
jgi:acyl-CoA thioester hydrolase